MNRTANISPPGDPDVLAVESDDTSLQSSVGYGESASLPGCDEFDQQVAHAQAQLEDLRQRQEEIEHQKSELEQLREKQSQFQCDRVEILENLQHALDVLERDYFDAEQRMEQYSRARKSFSQHLAIISGLRLEDWPRDQLHGELDRAAIAIDEAREEYQRTLSHLGRLTADTQEISEFAASAISRGETQAVKTAQPRSFAYWLRSGFAFTLPIMIFGIVSLIIMFFFN
ncbi:MAG: hypothetical protein VCA55_08875 [Verrucomicrobiales bacterium]